MNLRAVKDNREYTLTTEAEKKAYKARGFDIYGEDGKLLEYGAGKKVALEEYVAVKKERDDLVAENKKLTDENKKLKKELDALKKGE